MPNFNIDSFRAQFQGGARQYLFYFKPNFPASIAGADEMEKSTYLVRSTIVPESTKEEILLNWQGFDYKIPGKYTYNDFTVTFYVDVDARIQQIFYNWQRMMHDPTTNYAAIPRTVMADQQLELLDLGGQPIAKYKLVGAWPKMLGQITLDYSANEPAYFDVTFTYMYHVMDKIAYGNAVTFSG